MSLQNQEQAFRINLGTGKPFLITQAFAGYIKGKNGHLYAYEVVVNNGEISSIDDVFAIFEIDGQLSSMIYEIQARNKSLLSPLSSPSS